MGPYIATHVIAYSGTCSTVTGLPGSIKLHPAAPEQIIKCFGFKLIEIVPPLSLGIPVSISQLADKIPHVVPPRGHKALQDVGGSKVWRLHIKGTLFAELRM